jgi:DNA polymerase-3 subunit beta
MNITIRKTDLVRALQRCAPIANKRSAMPVLSCVHVASTDDGVTLTATDMFITVRTAVQCEAEEGSFAVDARDLLERLKHMPDGDVRLASTGKTVGISAKGTPRKFTLLTHPGADFPTVAFPSGEASVVTVDGATLGNAIDAVSYAISPDETRPHVNSMLLEWQGPSLRVVATDGHRLSKYEATCDAAGKGSVLIPLPSVGELRKLCDVDSVALRISGTSLVVETGGVSFLTRLVDSAFPPWQQVLPQARKVAIVPRIALRDAVDACAVAVKAGKNSGVKLTFLTGLLRVSAATPEGGEANDEIAADCTVNGEVSVGFAPQYLLAPLGEIDADEVAIDFGSELDPVVLSHGGLTAVVMPMRLA